MTVIGVALLAASASLLWAFTVLLWDLLEGWMSRRWLRVAVVVVLAPLCGLEAAAAAAMAGLALVMAFEPDQKPVGPSEPPPPARTEPTEPERTSEDRASPSASPSTPSPSASPSATPSPSASP
jgi:hypothetical protein